MSLDLPAPGLVWNRWALFASALSALGVDDVHRCADDGAHHDDHGGNWCRLVLVEGGRAVIFGYDHEYSETVHLTPSIDLLADAPAWLPWPELVRWQGEDQLGFVYWYENGTWSRVGYPEEDLPDGLLAIARAVLDPERARQQLGEMVFDWGKHERDDPAERSAVAEAATRLLAAAETGALEVADLDGLLGRLPADTVNLTAAMTVAQAAGITPGSGAPPVVPAGTIVPPRRIRVLSEDGHEELVRSAMREEPERQRPEPTPGAELAALVDLVRAQAPAEDGCCTLIVGVTDSSLGTQPGPRPPRALAGRQTDWAGFDEITHSVRALRKAETHPQYGRWFFLRLATTTDGYTVERRHDSWPDWFPAKRYTLSLTDLRSELARRAPEYHPSWTPLLDPEVAWREVPGS
ncbi:hypothetical protein [Micromonospora sp. DT229]|uniref:hypothetical protein n=1 Tax=Micromonospora sp. DT229 TaxID=3393430 RepID=UPI003CF8A03D